jgi:elongation factor G
LGFINKMDRSGADFLSVVSQMHEKLGANPVPLQIPIGSEENFRGAIDLIDMRAIIWNEDQLGVTYELQDIPGDMAEEASEWRMRLIESVADADDTVLEKYLDDPGSITTAELMAAIRKATIDLRVVPVLCGAAFKNKGIQRLLDAIVSFLPSPVDIEAVRGINPNNDQPAERKPEVSEPMSALAFKIATDPYVGRLAFLRIYSGRIDAGSQVLNVRTGKKERITRLFQMHANKQNPKDFVEAGDIIAAVGFKDLRTGDTLCEEKKPILLESINFPEPVIGVAIEPKTQNDLDRLGIALNKLSEEDPTFKVKYDEHSGQTIINGMGELHLEILVDRLKREFKVECNQGTPQVAYKEAITATIEHREVFKKQTGGRGKFADITVRISPSDEGISGLQFVDEVKGGNIPKEYIPSVQKGFREAMLNGVLAGYPVENLKVVLMDGSFHSVDSDSLSFEIAAKQAFRHALPKARPVLLEPIMKVEVVTPEEYMGDVIADFNRRRGHIEKMEGKAGARIIRAKVPLVEQFGYVTVLRTLTSGRATSTMEFSHYERVSDDISKRVLENTTGRRESA